MELKVLAVGDVVGEPGLERVRKSLRKLKRDTGADFVIVNGENASNVGMTPRQGDTIFDAGADVITMGNHTFSRREIIPYIEENRWVVPEELGDAPEYAPKTTKGKTKKRKKKKGNNGPKNSHSINS